MICILFVYGGKPESPQVRVVPALLTAAGASMSIDKKTYTVS